MGSKILAVQVRTNVWLRYMVDRVRESELGQGAAEYAGIIIAVLGVVAAVTAALTTVDIGAKVKTAIEAVFPA